MVKIYINPGRVMGPDFLWQPMVVLFLAIMARKARISGVGQRTPDGLEKRAGVPLSCGLGPQDRDSSSAALAGGAWAYQLL